MYTHMYTCVGVGNGSAVEPQNATVMTDMSSPNRNHCGSVRAFVILRFNCRFLAYIIILAKRV